MRGRRPRRSKRQLSQAVQGRCAAIHPNLVRARPSRDEYGVPVAALARCPEPCLAELLLGGPLSASQSVDLVGGLAAAIDALYEAGLVARDLTPYHVHLDPRLGGVLRDGAMPVNLVEPPVLDADEHLAYRSPEHIEGKPIDLRSNVYSLGAVLYAALVGRPPFGGTWSHVYVSHLSETRPRPSERRGDLPAAIDTVVTRALAVDPADRYDRPADLARSAATALDVELTIELVTPVEPEPAEQPSAKRTPARARTSKSSTPDKRGPAFRPRSTPEPKRHGKPVPVANGNAAAPNGKPAATNGKPGAANGKPAAATGKPAAAKGKRAAPNGKPAATNGKPATTNGKPATTNGKSNAAPAPASLKRDRSRAKRRKAEPTRTPGNDTPVREGVNGSATEAHRSDPAANGNGRRTEKRNPETIRAATRIAPVATGSYAIPTSNGSGGHVVAALASATTVVQLKPAVRSRRSGPSACPASVPVPAQPRKRSSRKGALLVLGAGGLAAAAVATIGMAGEDENRSSRIASNGLSIRMPAGWERVAPPTARLGWLSGTLGAAASDGSGAVLVSGLIREPAAGRRALRALLPDGATGRTVRLGGLEAVRYSELSLGAGLTGSAYVIHTTGPSIAMICRGPRVVFHQCAEAGATVTLRGERPVSPAVAARRPLLVRRAVRTLSAERTEGRRRVAAALVADDQARATRGLQASYVQAAGRVDLSGAYGARIEALSAALREASNSYGDLADSIDAGDQRAYDAARVAVVEAETQVWGESAAN